MNSQTTQVILFVLMTLVLGSISIFFLIELNAPYNSVETWPGFAMAVFIVASGFFIVRTGRIIMRKNTEPRSTKKLFKPMLIFFAVFGVGSLIAALIFFFLFWGM